MTKEKKAEELQIGDVIVAKGNGNAYTITHIMVGMARPYLTMTWSGQIIEHDTSFDSASATYTVKLPDLEKKLE